MRLIDADGFINKMNELYQQAGWDEREIHFLLSDTRGLMKPIKVFIKIPGLKLWEVAIDNTLVKLQELVGGYIEMVTIARNIVMILNEEGKLLDLPENFTFYGDRIRGVAIFAGTAGDGLANIPIDIDKFREMFPQVEDE